jgi:Domain of unknown function (DUF4394)
MRYYLAVAAALAMQLSATHAQTLVALIGDDILATVDTKTAKTTGLTKIEGIGPVLGVDVRPSDGQLYALASDGTIAIIDPATGKATPKSKLDMPLSESVQFTVDFNPVADKMRIIGSNGSNLRVDVDLGKVTNDQSLKFAETDAAAGRTPGIVAGAYSNSVKGAKETTLYDIDAEKGGLFRQAPPNDGILNTIGMTGLDADTVGFDIVADGAGQNTGLLVAKGNLYTLDLTTGKAGDGKAIAGLPSGVHDIAVLPAPATKQAATMMIDGGMDMKSRETISAYLPKAMPDNQTMDAQMKPAQAKRAPQMKAGYDMKMKVAGKPHDRADYDMHRSASSDPKMKKSAPQCNGRTAQY